MFSLCSYNSSTDTERRAGLSAVAKHVVDFATEHTSFNMNLGTTNPGNTNMYGSDLQIKVEI